MDGINNNNLENILSDNNQYFLNLLIPQEFQKNKQYNWSLLKKKNYEIDDQDQLDNIQNTEYLKQFEKFCKENPNLNSFPEEGYSYLKNFDLIHPRGYFNWLKFVEIYMKHEDLSDDLRIFVKHLLENIDNLDKYKSPRYNININQLEGQKICILKNQDNQYLIQVVSENSLQKFNLSPVFVQRDFQKTEIQDCAYVYKTKKLNKNEADFLKLLFKSLIENNKIQLPQFLKNWYKQNQNSRVKFAKKVQAKIEEERIEQKSIDKQIDKLDKYQCFLDLCFYFRTFSYNFSNFFTIEKEIDFYLRHSNVLQKKHDDSFLYFKNNVENVFEDCQNQKKKYIIESDCAICFSCDAYTSNSVIYCTKCGQGAHIRCLGMKEAPENDFYCGSCPDDKKNTNNICYFCKKKDLILLRKEKDRGSSEVYYHLFCMLAIKKWGFINHNQQSSLDMQRNKGVCIICEKNEYTENLKQCVDCNNYIHPICGYKQGYYFHLSDLEKQKYEDFTNGYFEYQIKPNIILNQQDKVHIVIKD